MNKSKLEISVNPQMELLMVVLLTSNYPDISRQILGTSVMTEERTEYVTNIIEHLSHYSDHPIYSLLDELIPKGFALGAPVEAVLSLGVPPKLDKIRDYGSFPLERAGGEEKLQKFTEQLRDFAEVTKFIEFYNKSLVYYEEPLRVFKDEVNKFPYVEILEELYGLEQESYNVYITQLSKGSFGPSIKKSNGKLEIYNICGFLQKTIKDEKRFEEFICNILWHEFSHAVINPLTESYGDLVEKYKGTYDEYSKSYKGKYAWSGPWDECINEHIIRAISIYLCRKYKSEEIAKERLNLDINLGYLFIPEILDKIDYYERNRESYKTIKEFYEDLLVVFKPHEK